jgi:hypothetical protein|tara:strand:+ start:570 stop:959 length:390 start_codon:yes stop_codon:yes gene_type:complete
MKNQAQLLLVSGLLMSITLIAVTSTITHSVNLGNHQGERHDITPIISSLENSFSLALEYEVLNAANGVELSTSFEIVTEEFESILASRGYSLLYTLTSATENSGSHTFVYSYELNDNTMSISLDKSLTF